MKKELTYLLALLFIISMNGIVSGQNNPIDFESGGYGATWTWTVFENNTNPPLEIIPNPDISGANTSATVAKFTALQSGNPWAGCESAHGTTDLGPFVLDESNSTIKIMVWKSVISDVGIKLVSANGWSQGEIKVPNTLVNQWEELTFNFAGYLNPPPAEGQFDQIVIFPDFDLAGRTQDNIIYFDNITFSPEVLVGVPTVPAPTPTLPASDVISVFSDEYDDIPGTNLNPSWGQTTVVSFLAIQGDTTMKYSNLNYQGIELGSNQNLTAAGMQYLHIDFWNATSTDLGVYLISPGPVEARVALVPPGTTETWVSVDILLSDFAPVNLTDVFQFKFDGNGTIYLDNIYFWDGTVPVELTLFTASVDNNNVQLRWKTATENNNSGFQVERKSMDEFETIGFVTGFGTTTEPMTYSFSDVNLNPGTYYYRLKQIDYDGTFSYSEVIEVNFDIPSSFELEQNYPNPFNPTTNISFSLPEASNVSLKVYNMLGQEVATLTNQFMNAGRFEITFDAASLPTGIYIYSLTAGNFNSVKKMMLIK